MAPKFSYTSYKNTNCNCTRKSCCFGPCCIKSAEPCVKDPCASRVKICCDGHLIPTHAMHVPLALEAVKRVSYDLCPPCPPPCDCYDLYQYHRMGHPLYHSRFMTTLNIYNKPVMYTKPPVPYWAYLFQQKALMALGPREGCPRLPVCKFCGNKEKGYTRCGQNKCTPVWWPMCDQCKTVEKQGQLQYIETMSRRS